MSRTNIRKNIQNNESKANNFEKNATKAATANFQQTSLK
jgi:uncharacterized protein YkuJ